MAKSYKMVELSEAGGEIVQYVGVYVLKWDRAWGQPTVGFCEDEEENTQAIEAIPDMIEALKAVVRWQDCIPTEVSNLAKAALEKAGKINE